MPQKSTKSKSFISTCSKRVKKVVALSTGSVAMAELLPVSNTAPGVLSAGNGPRSKHYINLKPRNKGVKKNSYHKDNKEEG